MGACGNHRDDLPRTHHAARRYRAGCGLMEGAPTAAELFAALRVLVAIDDERGLFAREAPAGGYRSETLARLLHVILAAISDSQLAIGERMPCPLSIPPHMSRTGALTSFHRQPCYTSQCSAHHQRP